MHFPRFVFLLSTPLPIRNIVAERLADDVSMEIGIVHFREPLYEAAVMMFKGGFTLDTPNITDLLSEPVLPNQSHTFQDWVTALDLFHTDDLRLPPDYLARLALQHYEGSDFYQTTIFPDALSCHIPIFVDRFGAKECLAIHIDPLTSVPSLPIRTIIIPSSDPLDIVMQIRREYGLAPEPAPAG